MSRISYLHHLIDPTLNLELLSPAAEWDSHLKAQLDLFFAAPPVQRNDRTFQVLQVSSFFVWSRMKRT